ncbi:class I SAM-dependent methyltransferase [Rhodovibrio salinarum]|uniref:Class I SAM-dependent methyltransferase n=1 Tax=Rhodovibrio salinarum TaxID=1087 RepID=A0A934QH62_9PROT|nr:class I SAM-dependent methyltransferase [Rhodovibrio salinarum]MBK1696470.1 class I SAM-dependent methyltransferase [Rhodovibrio salinarum]
MTRGHTDPTRTDDVEGRPDGSAHAGPEVWDANARAWTRAVREQRIASRAAGTDATLLTTLTRLAPGRLLDAGCGEGWLIRALRQHMPNCWALGIDGAPALIVAARAADPNGCYHLLTYDALAAQDWRADPVLAERLADPVDVVVFNYALFDRDIRPTLRAARALLAPGGAVVIQTLPPCASGAEGWRTEEFTEFGEASWVPMTWYARSRAAWESALADAGLVSRTEQAPTPDALSLLLVAQAM